MIARDISDDPPLRQRELELSFQTYHQRNVKEDWGTEMRNIMQNTQEQYRETVTPSEELKRADCALRECKRLLERKSRVIDYTPIGDRDKPCLNGCIHFIPDRAGCWLGGNIVKLVERCPDYRKWMVSRFSDGEIGLEVYLGKLREKRY